MNTKPYIVGVFNDEEPLMEACYDLRERGIRIHEVFSPFPIHGIDPILGYRRTRLTVAAFIYGCIGLSLAIFMQSWMYGVDWQVNVGGKPRFPFPSFVPVSFELTVLITAFGMMASFFAVCKLYPGKEARIAHPRATNDRFVITLRPQDVKDADVSGIMMNHGALEVYRQDLTI